MAYAKKSLLFGLILIILPGVYLLLNILTGFGDYPIKHVPHGFVRTDFENQSGETIIGIRMVRGAASPSFSILKKSILPDKTRVINKKHRGEGTFVFEVELSSGKRLLSNEMYVEEGYYIHQTVKSDTVISDY